MKLPRGSPKNFLLTRKMLLPSPRPRTRAPFSSSTAPSAHHLPTPSSRLQGNIQNLVSTVKALQRTSEEYAEKFKRQEERNEAQEKKDQEQARINAALQRKVDKHEALLELFGRFESLTFHVPCLLSLAFKRIQVENPSLALTDVERVQILKALPNWHVFAHMSERQTFGNYLKRLNPPLLANTSRRHTLISKLTRPTSSIELYLRIANRTATAFDQLKPQRNHAAHIDQPQEMVPDMESILQEFVTPEKAVEIKGMLEHEMVNALIARDQALNEIAEKQALKHSEHKPRKK
ncbi:hypothetical protein JCM10213_009023 [Rhodosporidiobolus nylandii]